MSRAFARLSAVALCAAATLTTQSAHAAPPIGGDRLTGTATVVSYGTGASKLPSLSADGYLIADLDTGEILAAKNAHGQYAPASTMKVLTFDTLWPKVPASTPITATFEDAAIRGSRVGVVEKMTYKADDLYRAMLMVSGNDAALTLSEANGGPAKTVADMSAEAVRLQALDTVVKSVNGLDTKGQVTSAYDLALFGRQGMTFPEFRAYVKTVRADFPTPPAKKGGKPGKFQIYSHNSLLTGSFVGTLGIKNGWTDWAKFTYVAAAERGGHRLIATIMHSDFPKYQDAATLLNWGFANYGKVSPVGMLVSPVVPPGAAGAGSNPSALPSAGASAPATPAPAASNTTGAAPASSSPANSTILLVGGIGGGVLLAGVAALAFGRRRRDKFPSFTDGPVVEELPRSRHPSPEIVVPPTPAPTYTSNIRVVRSDD